MKIISVGVCLKALILLKNLHHPSETNRIDNYVRWLVVGFEIFTKSSKITKMFENYHPKNHENENRPYLGQKL